MTIHNDTEASLPSVSIVVTTFNRVSLLSETIDSILGQTYTDFELIIVDNMSKDGAKECVVGIADSRIRYYRNSNNGVIAVNRTSETLRAIRTVKSIVKLIEVPRLFAQVNIDFQYLKYILYFIVK